MGKRSATVGAALLALLVVVNIISLFVTYTPAAVIVGIIALGLIILAALGMWAAGRSPRSAMWVAVVAATLSALMAIPPLFIPDMTAVEMAYFVLYIVLTVVVLVLVRGELRRSGRDGRSGRHARSSATVA